MFLVSRIVTFSHHHAHDSSPRLAVVAQSTTLRSSLTKYPIGVLLYLITLGDECDDYKGRRGNAVRTYCLNPIIKILNLCLPSSAPGRYKVNGSVNHSSSSMPTPMAPSSSTNSSPSSPTMRCFPIYCQRPQELENFERR